ncbi:MAG: 4Fe-4S binding protein [Candidatus Omnitrophica bacterium]|nr:4Fe-4S binding protein [Candidatus Omnitrophota bacterium]MCM8827108.1 4Fe-4S binding protein [Candidatus Omnitrophota bacterium]
MKRLFVDLEKCDSCPECVIKCSYIYHFENAGITSLREFVTFALVCRRCQDSPCVNSCYRKALKKDANGMVKRSSFLCTSCKTCSIACPFGVILPDFLTFLVSKCDLCIGRDNISCIGSCPYNAISLENIEGESVEEGIYIVSDYLAVRSKNKWLFDDRVLYKKK